MEWEDLRRCLAPLTDSLIHLGAALAEMDEYDIEGKRRPDFAANAPAGTSPAPSASSTACHQAGAAMIYWAEARREADRVSLHAAPLHVGPLVEKHLWMAKEAVVLTSAT